MAREKSMDVRKIVSMPDDLVERIAAYRHDNRIGSEAEAIRVLLDLGLKAAKMQSEGAR